jgi:hypothetical protein
MAVKFTKGLGRVMVLASGLCGSLRCLRLMPPPSHTDAPTPSSAEPLPPIRLPGRAGSWNHKTSHTSPGRPQLDLLYTGNCSYSPTTESSVPFAVFQLVFTNC